jgi:hypothetical protein
MARRKMIKPVYIIGDVHAEWNALKAAIKDNGIQSCTLICVGDLGIGFRHPYKEARIHEDLNRFFEQREIDFLSIRGNHDDPSYFSGELSRYGAYSNFYLLPDYTRLEINGEDWLFVGGAISIDRNGPHRKEGSSYWPDEVFRIDGIRADLAGRKTCDVLVTHSAPTWSGPAEKSGLVEGYCKNDPTLWKECQQERKDHDTLYEIVKPKTHYAGHFHHYYNTRMNGSTSIILDILQIKEHRKP